MKVSAVLYLCLWLVITVAGVILWQVARVTGTLDNLQSFLATALADDSFTIDGSRVLLSALFGARCWSSPEPVSRCCSRCCSIS